MLTKKLKELWWSDASLESYCSAKITKNVNVSNFLKLWVAITLLGCIKSPWFFDHFSYTFDALSECVNWYLTGLLQFSPNLSHIVSQGLFSSSLNLMTNVPEASMKWNVQKWFSDARCDIVSFKCTNNFLTRECNRSSKKVFGSRTIFTS